MNIWLLMESQELRSAAHCLRLTQRDRLHAPLHSSSHSHKRRDSGSPLLLSCAARKDLLPILFAHSSSCRNAPPAFRTSLLNYQFAKSAPPTLIRLIPRAPGLSRRRSLDESGARPRWPTDSLATLPGAMLKSAHGSETHQNKCRVER